MGNSGDGVLIDKGANENAIGGGAPGDANVISANLGNGIHMTGTGSVKAGIGTTENTVLGNHIGTDITGAKALGNSGDGILLDGGANYNAIGDGTSADANIISANLAMASI